MASRPSVKFGSSNTLAFGISLSAAILLLLSRLIVYSEILLRSAAERANKNTVHLGQE